MNLPMFYNSATLSDITLKFNGHQLKAHKVLLIAYSDYFKAALSDSRFKEADSDEFVLEEDDPQAIKGLVAWMYGLHYEGCHHYSDRAYEPDPRDLEEGLSYAKYLVNLYVAADKYAVQSLCDHIKAESSCCRLASVLGKLHVEADISGLRSYPDGLGAMARYIHGIGGKIAADLLPSTVACVRDSNEHFWGNGEGGRRQKLRLLIEAAPDAGYALLECFAEGREYERAGREYDRSVRRR